jgi:hypothetical protein
LFWRPKLIACSFAFHKEWDKFKEETKHFYDVSMDVLEEQFDREQKEYYIQSAIWYELLPEHIVSTPVIIKRLDLHTCTLHVSYAPLALHSVDQFPLDTFSVCRMPAVSTRPSSVSTSARTALCRDSLAGSRRTSLVAARSLARAQ